MYAPAVVWTSTKIALSPQSRVCLAWHAAIPAVDEVGVFHRDRPRLSNMARAWDWKHVPLHGAVRFRAPLVGCSSIHGADSFAGYRAWTLKSRPQTFPAIHSCIHGTLI